MALIDDTYFVFDLSLPAGKYSDIPGWINRLEGDLIRKIVGLSLAVPILDYSESSEQRIKDIVEGVGFEVDGIDYYWNGLVNDNKKSLIAYYVYTKYLRNNITFTTGTGERKAKNENSHNANQSIKYWRAHQRYMEEVTTLLLFLNANADLYPEFVDPGKSINNDLNPFDI